MMKETHTKKKKIGSVKMKKIKRDDIEGNKNRYDEINKNHTPPHIFCGNRKCGK